MPIDIQHLTNQVLNQGLTGRALKKVVRLFYLFSLPLPVTLRMYANEHLDLTTVASLLSGQKVSVRD